jgi:hypothetical protein
MEINSKHVIDTLREGVVQFSFEKVKDGEVRTMSATLKTDLIPEDKMPKSGKVDDSVEGLSTVRCFDVDKGEWRSFRIDKLVTFPGVK